MSVKIDFYQIIIIFLSILVLGSVGYIVYAQQRGTLGKSAVSIDVEYGKASVSINGETKGETPIQREDLYAGDIKIELNSDQGSYSTVVSPAAGTKAIIKRDLGVSKEFSSGQNIWFTKSSQGGKSVSVISPDLSDVQVIVDEVEMGKTPVSFTPKDLLSQDENDEYKLIFKKDGYEEQEVEVKLSEGFTLNIRADLFLNPLPKEISALPGAPVGVNFVNFSNAPGPSANDKQSWAKAINYWLQTRGSVTVGNYKLEKINYFLSDSGKFYNDAGNEISNTDVKFEENVFLAYLGSSQSTELTEDAKKALAEASGTAVVSDGTTSTEQVEILATGIGYLRVRSKPSTAGTEVGRVDVGKKFPLISEENGWYEIEYETGKNGWISGTYAKKVTP